MTDDPKALRERAATDGYLFFRRLLPASSVLEVRRELLRVVDRFGWRVPGQNPLGGRIDLAAINRVPESEMRTDIGVSLEAYREAQKLECVHSLPHHAKLLGFYRKLFGEDVLVHARHIIRMITSHACMVPTPPHQDFPLIQGTDRTWTAWIPLGDCPREMGGLTVLRGSHRLGYVPLVESRGAGGIAARTCPWETDWVEGDYMAGDVLTFPSHTIHKALPCKRREEIRLSLDVRYQPASEPVEQRSLLPHADLEWEDIYSGWSRDDLKYYWRTKKLTLTPRDESLVQPSRRIC